MILDVWNGRKVLNLSCYKKKILHHFLMNYRVKLHLNQTCGTQWCSTCLLGVYVQLLNDVSLYFSRNMVIVYNDIVRINFNLF